MSSRRAIRTVAVIAALGLGVISGCGGGTSSDAPVAASSANSVTPDAAKADLAEYTKRPTTIPLTTPVSKPIPTGKKIAYISCGTAAICSAIGQVAGEAASVLGWTVETYPTDGTADKVRNAWETVLRNAPDGIIYTATPPTMIGKYVEEAAAKGIPVAACCVVDDKGVSVPPGAGLVYNIGSNQAEVRTPVWISQILAAAGTAPADVVYVYPDYATTKHTGEVFIQQLEAACAECSGDMLPVQLTELSKTPQAVVSYLRSHPKVKYVVQGSTNATDAGLTAAIKAAGLTDIFVTGAAPGATTLDEIAAGTEAGVINFPLYEYYYGALDAIARTIVGDQVQPAFTPDAWLLTKDNVGDVPSGTVYFPQVVDIRDQFAKLWGKV
ncbi:sugar ABC transporter substrate-binding protein [Pseudonocardia sp. RS010]|uniref:sugar ABC transporter substrate-binding protein n=1 Tax=Pseudonocardia sp. RS010 TaxID=3385979 RepID=UPI00399F8B1D